MLTLVWRNDPARVSSELYGSLDKEDAEIMDPIQFVLNVRESYGVAYHMDAGGAYLTAWTLESIGLFRNQREILVFDAIHDVAQADIEGVDLEVGELFHQLLLVAFLDSDCSPQINRVFRIRLKQRKVLR